MIDSARTQAAVIVLAAYTLLIGVAGYAFGRWLHAPAPAPAVAAMPLPEVHQPDGSVIAAREPVRAARPAQMLPKGAAVTSTARIAVRPRPVHTTGGDVHISGEGAHCLCDDMVLDVTTFRDPLGERLAVSAEGGDVLGATHWPVIGEMSGARSPHAVGLSWRRDGALGSVGGVVYQYDWGRLRLGAMLEYQGQHGIQPGAQIVYRFN